MMEAETITRAEHVRWCKSSAREYLARNDPASAVASMLSDLSKHTETAGIAKTMGPMCLLAAQSMREARRFVEGVAE